MNAGLGLGLPSTMTYCTSTSGRSMSTKTVIPASQPSSFDFDGDYLFPIPSKNNGRQVSAETVRVRDLQSYWSPNSEADMESDNEEDEQEEEFNYESDYHSSGEEEEMSPLESYSVLATPEEGSLLSPLQLAAHACLHLLSPKAEALAQAAAVRGVSAEDALSNALEWAWLVPMVDTTAKVAEQTFEAIKEPLPLAAPAMRSMPSLSSIASSISLRSDSRTFSVISDSSIVIPGEEMLRSHSIHSSLSISSLSTAATSAMSVMDRKRPVSSSFARAPSSQIIKLRGSRSRMNLNSEPQQKLPALAKRASVRSQSAEVETCSASSSSSFSSPSSEQWAIMLQPMEKLPSPAVSATASYSAPSIRSRSDSRLDTRATLFEIWSAAEEADRARRTGASIEGTLPASTSSSSSKRVSKWVNKVRKSTSTASLLKRMNLESEASAEVVPSPMAEEDPVAWAGKALEEIMEPREEVANIPRRGSIDEIVRIAAAVQKPEGRTTRKASNNNDAVWAFLG